MSDIEIEVVECDVCHEEKPLDRVRTLHAESWGCNECIENFTHKQIAEELIKSVYPCTVQEILDDLEYQLGAESRFDKWWKSLSKKEKFDAEYPPDKEYTGHDTTFQDKQNAFYKAVNEGKA